jgi:ribose 5-phosphate isomerase B
MKWALGYDHAGFTLANRLAHYLASQGDTCLHFGPADASVPVDYAQFCIAAATHVSEGAAEYGIVLGGTGQGEQIAANKVKGIRAALCVDERYALFARRDNDANVMALPARRLAYELAIDILETWRSTSFEGGRHARRISQITAFEDHSLEISTLKPRVQGV